MALLGQFDGGVGEVAPAVVLGDETCAARSRKPYKLADGIAGALALDVGPDFLGFLALVIEIFEDQIVLGIEVAVERHLVGAGGLGDGLDADAANAVAMKQILRRLDDAVAWWRAGALRDAGVDPASHFSFPWPLTSMLPIGI